MKNLFFFFIVLFSSWLPSYGQMDTLTGILIANQDLDTNSCYVLKDCYVVPRGYTLRIAPGVSVLAMPGSRLIVEPGGRIEAKGTALLPIVFTSIAAAGTRQAGDWYGITIGGEALYNDGLIDLGSCSGQSAGGSNTLDDSGWLQYVQIHYAGAADALGDTRKEAALNLMAIGSATVVDHIQVSNAATDGIHCIGGSVALKEVYLLNNYRKSIVYSDGYNGNAQTLLIVMQDANAHHSDGTDAIIVQNNYSATTASPVTVPTLSNVTALGILYCDSNAVVSADFKDGLVFQQATKGNVYNSVFSGFNYGVYIADATSAAYTHTDELNLSFVSCTGNKVAPYDHDLGFVWNSVNMCENSMYDWIEAENHVFTCEEVDNKFQTFDTRYNSSFCGDYCDPLFSSNFVINAPAPSELENPDYSMLSNFFDNLTYRGAVQNASLFDAWIEVCALNRSYCPPYETKMQQSPSPLQIHPNPAGSNATIGFEALQTGIAQLYITDKVSGSVWYQVSYTVHHKGHQQLHVPLHALPENVYIVQVVMDSDVWYGRLIHR
jgi:hypothetical protein